MLETVRTAAMLTMRHHSWLAEVGKGSFTKTAERFLF